MRDPLKIIIEDINPLIFQHFDTHDIRRITLVSKLWNQIIGSSRQCMRKITCRIDRPSLQVNALKQSSRHYENFKIAPRGYYEELSVILNYFDVKNVWINDTSDKEVEHNEYVNFMRSFADTIEYLQTGDISTKNSSRMTVINFPKLKKLHCSFTNRSAFSIFLGDNKNLETVILSSELYSCDDEFLNHNNIISEFLSKNQQIRNLWLLHLEKLFVYDISSKVTQKLRHITFTTNFQNTPRHAKQNFIKFIKSQWCLESLNMMGCRDKSIVVDIWNGLVKFNKLFVIDCNFYEELHSFDLRENLNIEEIDFYLSSSLHAFMFLQAAPNIVSYKIRQLSKQLLEFSIRNLKCLKEIKYQSIDGDAAKYFKEIIRSCGRRPFKVKELDFFEYLNIEKQ
ncbi:unnamed protein product [Chironomus riparius]|uniref:F-box domain-containing protein n=1 Tax=Chironomus riparius TaxID=315576 RepID=A0A9N9RP66_9DIPT|nr:unnamed protein product [Chironomus riparius]